MLCTGAYHLSKRTTQRVMEDLFGLPMSLGTIANLERVTAQALTAPVAKARACVQAQPLLYCLRLARSNRASALLHRSIIIGERLRPAIPSPKCAHLKGLLW
jgi:hypothetical protein